MRDLNHDLKELCRHNRDGSYATRADREHILALIANQLHEMGHRGLRAQGLKSKHVEKLAGHWLTEDLSPGTIKNRMRRCAGREKLGKDSMVARAAAYGIRIGCMSPTSPAKQLGMDQLGHPHACARCRCACRLPSACAGSLDQDRPGLGRSGRYAGAEGFLEQGGRR